MIALVTRAVEMATHVTARRVTSNSSAIDDSASDTIEKSSTIANSAMPTTQNTFQWYPSLFFFAPFFSIGICSAGVDVSVVN